MLQKQTNIQTKINSKWVKGLNIKTRNYKILKETQGEKFHDTGVGDDFLDMTKAKIDQWHYIKLKNFCVAKGTLKSERQPMEWRKYCKPHTGEGVNIQNL